MRKIYKEKYNLEVSEKTMNYILTGLEFYCIYINNCYYLTDGYSGVEKDIQYADVFYTYHYLLSLCDSRRRIRLEEPDYKISKKVLSSYDFINQKEIS